MSAESPHPAGGAATPPRAEAAAAPPAASRLQVLRMKRQAATAQPPRQAPRPQQPAGRQLSRGALLAVMIGSLLAAGGLALHGDYSPSTDAPIAASAVPATVAPPASAAPVPTAASRPTPVVAVVTLPMAAPSPAADRAPAPVQPGPILKLVPDRSDAEAEPREDATAAEPAVGPRQAELAAHYAAAEAAWGHDDDAVLRELEAVYALDPGYRDVVEKLYAALIARADRQASAGDLDGARATLARAVKLAPERPEASDALAALDPTPVPSASGGPAVSRPSLPPNWREQLENQRRGRKH